MVPWSNDIQYQLKYDLTHRSLDKMVAISRATFSDAFSKIKSFEFWFEFHWCVLVLRAITWTYDDEVHQRIYAALEEDGSSAWFCASNIISLRGIIVLLGHSLCTFYDR